MLRRFLISAMASTLLAATSSTWAYDEGLAESYAELFEPVAGVTAGKALHMMKTEAFLEKVKSGAPIATLDIRTPAETSIFTSALPGGLAIPVNELFSPENLGRIPTDRDVVVLCKSGTRATAAGTALRHIGFENVYILKGGYKALNAHLDARTANSPPKTGKPN